jgi:hypothetical protein
MRVGRLELPRLRELVIQTSALERETLAAIGDHAWPNLEKLELWFGERRCTCTMANLEPIIGGSQFPRLRHLALRNCAVVDQICQALATAPITPQLRVLDLSLGALTETGAAALMSARRSLEHLAVLDLRHHFFDADAIDGIDMLAGFVDTSDGAAPRPELEDDPGPPRVWLDA